MVRCSRPHVPLVSLFQLVCGNPRKLCVVYTVASTHCTHVVNMPLPPHTHTLSLRMVRKRKTPSLVTQSRSRGRHKLPPLRPKFRKQRRHFREKKTRTMVSNKWRWLVPPSPLFPPFVSLSPFKEALTEYLHGMEESGSDKAQQRYLGQALLCQL